MIDNADQHEPIIMAPDELQTLTIDDVASLLNTPRQNVMNLVNYELLLSIKLGNKNLVTRWDLRKFLEDYRGMDLSNASKMIEARRMVRSGNVM